MIGPLWGEKDEAKRIAGWKAVDKYIAEKGYVIPLVQYSQPIVFKSSLKVTPISVTAAMLRRRRMPAAMARQPRGRARNPRARACLALAMSVGCSAPVPFGGTFSDDLNTIGCEYCTSGIT